MDHEKLKEIKMDLKRVRRMVKVVSSPNYSDEELPWYYTGFEFKKWVWENLSSERFPVTVKEALDIARGVGYEVIVAKKYIDPKLIKL